MQTWQIMIKTQVFITQSLGCWHGFTAQQMMMEIKRSHTTTSKRYVYLSGWMIAALRSEFGLPDQRCMKKLQFLI